jgi:hypothetical protein
VQVFKLVPTEQALYEGVVTHDVPLILDTCLHLARGLATLHAADLVHGELTDSTVFIGLSRMRREPGAEMAFGSDVRAWFGSLGAAPLERAARLDADALQAARPDYVLCFAPERFSGDGTLLPGAASAKADVWALGVLLAYLLRYSLLLVKDGPLVRARRTPLVSSGQLCLLCCL